MKCFFCESETSEAEEIEFFSPNPAINGTTAWCCKHPDYKCRCEINRFKSTTHSPSWSYTGIIKSNKGFLILDGFIVALSLHIREKIKDTIWGIAEALWLFAHPNRHMSSGREMD